MLVLENRHARVYLPNPTRRRPCWFWKIDTGVFIFQHAIFQHANSVLELENRHAIFQHAIVQHAIFQHAILKHGILGKKYNTVHGK